MRTYSAHLRRAVTWLTALAAALVLVPRDARAQQNTFYLDRAQISHAPDDGFVVWRPYLHPVTRFYGNVALGYSLNPLRIDTVSDSGNVQQKYDNPLEHQLITYLGAGTEIASRLGFNISLPIALYQTGGEDPIADGVGNGIGREPVAVHDLRIDTRLKTYESNDGLFRIGGAFALWIPTGNAKSFASDDELSFAILGNMEFDFGSFLLSGMLGPHFRPRSGIGGPNGALRVASELRYAGGAYLKLRDGKLRLGGELWGTTGLGEDTAGEGTFFRGRNTDFEWLGQARFTLDERQRWFTQFGGGTRLATGYGGPDLRLLASIGYYATLKDFEPTSPPRRIRVSGDVVDKEPDRDGDGYPDSIDKCPDEPEDRKEPDPTDGCPLPADRDGDGIPDHLDKCPDVAEDFDNIQDGDGCPEEDADNDKVPDVEDRCPTEPGPRSKIAEKNGCPTLTRVTEDGEVELLENIQFDYNKATIKPVSFPILDEVVTLMEARPTLRIGVYGHTDNRGNPGYNKRLSTERADAVMRYLISKGIAASRLESAGFGQEKPIASNATDAGRAKNRRVEFKILEGGDD